MVVIEDTRQKAGKHDRKHEYFDANGVAVVRCKLPFGDYAPMPPVSVDTKEDFEEIANNICGKEHTRFINECKGAQAAGCHLIILVENLLGITDISEVHTWINPRVIYSPKCVQGARLQKAMETISERYDVEFAFCHPDDTGQRIMELIESWKQRTNY